MPIFVSPKRKRGEDVPSLILDLLGFVWVILRPMTA
jgi:hypothetical protein